MSELLRFFKDMRDNGYGLAEIAAQLGTSAIAEPVAGFAAMYDPQHGADAIREGMTYQPRTQEAQQYSQSVGNAAKTAIKPAMPIIDTWKKGVDIAGRYSPVVGAGLRTVPTAIGIAMGAKPALQAGRQVSEGLGAMQGRMIANANAPRTLNTGFRGQRGVFAGINALTADKEALAKAQQMIAQGVDPEDVWQETGWGRGADGKWRFEIDDSKARLRDYQFTPTEAYNNARRDAFVSGDNAMTSRAKSMEQYASMTKNQLKDEYKRTGNEIVDAAINGDIEKAKWLSEQRSGLDALLSQMGSREYGKASSFIAHGDLGEAYPDVYKIHTRISPEEVGNARGHYSRGNDLQSERVVLGEKPIFDSHKSTMLHELQHAIQQREGFARGGSPEQFEGSPQFRHMKYQRLAGEVEARMVQNRMNLTPEQRRDTYPFAIGRYGYEDIPKADQLIDFGNNKAMSQRPLTEFEQAHLTAQRNAIGTLSTDDDLRALARFNQMDDVYKFDNSHEYYDPIDRLVARNLSDDSFDFMELPTSYGKMSITPSAKEQGKWQVTQWAKDGNPLSDSGNLTKEKALRVFFEDSRPELLSPPKRPLTEFEQAHLTAQRNAALPVNQGGLGLPADNTAMDRARAMGFDVDNPVYHGTNWDFDSFDLGRFGSQTSMPPNFPKGIYTAPSTEIASRYGKGEGSNIIPLLMNKKNPISTTDTISSADAFRRFNVGDADTFVSSNVAVARSPSQLRSRFAAFDPFNRESSNLLAQSAPLVPTTALGAYMYNEKRKKSQGNQ